MRFKKENVNPLKKNTGDCVIRAITKATNRDWIKVLDDLFIIARKIFSVPNWHDTYYKYLEEFEMKTCVAVKGKARKKVQDFMGGTYILKTANHLTCVIDGVNYDTWDNRMRCVYRYWKIK